jgi:hypothetical protein
LAGREIVALDPQPAWFEQGESMGEEVSRP